MPPTSSEMSWLFGSDGVKVPMPTRFFSLKAMPLDRHVLDLAAVLVLEQPAALRAEVALDVDAELLLDVGAQIRPGSGAAAPRASGSP